MRGAAGVRLLLVFALTAASLAAALWGVELRAVGQALATVRPGMLSLAIAVVALVFLARVLRFHLLLGEGRPTFARQVTVCGVGFLAIQVVPLRLGEFVRPFMLEEDGVPWGRALGAVVLERVIDLVMLLAMMLGVSLLVELPATIVVQGVDVLAAGQRGTSVLLAALLGGLFALAVSGARLDAAFARVPVVGARVASFAGSMRGAVSELIARPAVGAAAVLLGAAVWGLTILSVAVLLRAFPGLPVSGQVALTVTAVTVAGTVAVPTPGMVGPFEVFCKATLLLWAVDPDLATALAITWHATAFGFHAVMGVGLLVAKGLSLGQLVRASRAARPAADGP